MLLSLRHRVLATSLLAGGVAGLCAMAGTAPAQTLLALRPAAREAAAVGASAARAPAASLPIWTDGRWRSFWSADRAPTSWERGHDAVLKAVAWRAVMPGIELGELRLAGSGTAWRVRVGLVRIDPARLDFQLHAAVRDAGTRGAWTIDSIPDGARLAFNAGQFRGGLPWGWLVVNGKEQQPPGQGPLAMSVTFDSVGRAALLHGDEVDAARRRGDVLTAFQSYPAVLVDEGAVPLPLREPGRGVDLEHRDTRLALDALRDGRLLLALTRFDALGDAAAGSLWGRPHPRWPR